MGRSYYRKLEIRWIIQKEEKYGLYLLIRQKGMKWENSPALIISSDRNNMFTESVTVLPITSNISKVYPFEVLLSKDETNLKIDSKVKCNQIRTIDKKRLLNVLCTLSTEVLNNVRKALLIHLDL